MLAVAAAASAAVDATMAAEGAEMDAEMAVDANLYRAFHCRTDTGRSCELSERQHRTVACSDALQNVIKISIKYF